MDTMSYRFGTIDCTCVGIPELEPGRFIEITGLGSPAANKFYVTDVTHTFNEAGYQTKLQGKAAKIEG
jgi:hypothetical protein